MFVAVLIPGISPLQQKGSLDPWHLASIGVDTTPEYSKDNRPSVQEGFSLSSDVLVLFLSVKSSVGKPRRQRMIRVGWTDHGTIPMILLSGTFQGPLEPNTTGTGFETKWFNKQCSWFKRLRENETRPFNSLDSTPCTTRRLP